MVELDAGDIATALAGAGGIAAALAATPPALPEDDLPRGPARRPAETIVSGLQEIDGLDIMDAEFQSGAWMLEFHLPDRDIHYPSGVSLDRATGLIVEVTLRLGPLGDQSEVDRETWNDLEGQFADVVLDSASAAGIVDAFPTTGARGIDLGDKWVADEVRPHVRLRHTDSGYDITPREFVTFVSSLVERFEDRFGTYEERRTDPRFESYFR